MRRFLRKLFPKARGGGWEQAPDTALAQAEFLKRHREGISPQVQAQMYEQAREGGLREARGARKGLLRQLGRMGKLTSPAGAYREVEMQEGMIPMAMGIRRDIGLAGEEAKERGLAGYAALTGRMQKQPKRRPWYQKLLRGVGGLLARKVGG
ncbi:MAG: hypothetical protein DDT19_02748 [Syntrophomonadaceae bacterium]|nr:hypothetical protein [Bacillota bacterium]